VVQVNRRRNRRASGDAPPTTLRRDREYGGVIPPRRVAPTPRWKPGDLLALGLWTWITFCVGAIFGDIL